MATQKVIIGDTFTAHVEFTDVDGVLTDADGTAVTFTAYSADGKSTVDTGSATRISQGIYEFNWLVPGSSPANQKTYILEMKGLFSTEPQLQRLKVKAVFRT
jgi:hypothetical protein